MSLHYYLFGLAICSVSAVSYCFWRIFKERDYKILKDYEFKDSRIQLIVNPQNNICGICFELLNENDEIAKFHKCDHHFHPDCIHDQIEKSHSQLPGLNPCPMCMDGTSL